MAVPSFWYKVTSVQWVTLLVTDYATSCHQFVPSVIRHMLTVPYISGSGPSQPLLGSRWIHVWIRQQKTWSIRRWNYSGIMCIKNVLKIVPAQSGRPVCDSLSDGSRHWFSLPSVTSYVCILVNSHMLHSLSAVALGLWMWSSHCFWLLQSSAMDQRRCWVSGSWRDIIWWLVWDIFFPRWLMYSLNWVNGTQSCVCWIVWWFVLLSSAEVITLRRVYVLHPVSQQVVEWICHFVCTHGRIFMTLLAKSLYRTLESCPLHPLIAFASPTAMSRGCHYYPYVFRSVHLIAVCSAREKLFLRYTVCSWAIWGCELLMPL